MNELMDTGYEIRDIAEHPASRIPYPVSRIPYPASRILLLTFLLLFPPLLFSQVSSGADRTDAYFPLLKGKRIGIVANNASVVGHVNTVDLLVQEGFKIERIFSPEHGFRTEAEAGQIIGNSIDPVTGISVVSLYGAKKQPGVADMKAIDLVIFDIQDVGVRFYTYISTLTYVMEACAENKVPLILLDRLNPNGFYIDGPVLEKKYASFVGMHPVPVVYGMTIGEYACMVNGEGWLKKKGKCDLKVIRIANYTHDTRCDLPAKPSPNLPNINAIYLYPSLCFFEGTIVSIGRGTSFPFEVIGHPGMKQGDFSFTPRSLPGISLHPPCEGEECHGIDLQGFLLKHPDRQGKIILSWLLESFRDLNRDTAFFDSYFDKLAGNSTLRKQILGGKTEKEIRQSWQPGIKAFRKIRSKYLLY
jgi:uncharacterized protein YbbC (DUF1343 family)